MSNTQPTVVGGRYELGELLGRGGMAEVRKGTDTRLGRVVAVKRLRTDLASDATFQARFRREAQSSASLNHPTIVAVYDTGEEPATDGSGVAQPYIVMEFVAGRTLRDILREGRKILPERALEISSGVLSALDYSHRAGIIHRDIKPGNVMLTPAGDVKVMDFGIARAMSDAQSTMTQTAAVVGTAQYLSPEQARGETVDSRSDVYSAGCLLYELLTGRPPFVGDSPVAVAYQHVREPVTPPSDHDTDIPPELDAIVMKALAKRLEERYQSAAAMRTDIERYLAGRPVEAAVVPPGTETAPTAVVSPVAANPVTPTAVAPRPLPEEEEYDEEPRRRTWLWVLLALLVAGLIVAGAILWPRLFEAPPEQVQVPDTVGKGEDKARDLLGDAGLAVGPIDTRPDDNVPAGKVIDQDPNADEFVDPNTEVTLVISEGPPEKAVPPVVGLSRGQAATELRNAGFQVDPVEEESDEEKGQVLRAEPAVGTLVPEGAEITIFYSDGREQVPDVVDLQQADAEQQIRDAKFTPVVVPSSDTTEPAGTVIQQIPEAGTELEEGQQVTIVVSTFVEPTEPTETPDPTDPTEPTETPPFPPVEQRRALQRMGSA
jgi:beta-lactam-binding protein with PASTA domain/tRNA A-37 threonylcarbamoyl transferase component Bud32